tara:strand:+ start:9304 stop:9897 length:594 start_codon:yes stop_codon:yes gene_type:complete
MALTTELESVNQMLGHIGEAPVNSLADTAALPISGSIALTTLREIAKEVQTEEWHFNTVKDHEIEPNGDSKIPLPANTLFVDAVNASNDYVQRGLFLYNRKDKTFTFTSSVKLDLTEQLVWDDLPEPARRYITLRASRVFQGRIVGSRELESLIAVDEMQARARLQELDSQSSDRTIFDSLDVNYRLGVNREFNVRV